MRLSNALRGFAGDSASRNRRASTSSQVHSLLCYLAVFAVLAMMLCPAAQAQTDEWVWMGGQSTFLFNNIGDGFLWGGVYGTKGVASPQNLPGFREGPVTWTDKQGNLWMFGGYSQGAGNPQNNPTYGFMNDLSKFTPSTNEWTWVAGSDSAGNCQEPSSGSVLCGTPGRYGVQGVASAENTPGGRENAATWTDGAGNLWLFGGLGYEPGVGLGYFNDLWRFDPATLEWTWISGSDTVPGSYLCAQGVYGKQGVAAVGNIPGGRGDTAAWTDSKGNFWLFGGAGCSANEDSLELNELWEYNHTTGEWAWISGSDSAYTVSGVYGTQGVANLNNMPGGRQNASGWVDTKGNFWIFGGNGAATQNLYGFLNDLWRFNPATKEWTWMNGSNSPGSFGTYPQTGLGGNGYPSARDEAAQWTDLNGNLWLMGGAGADPDCGYGCALNDLWRFTPATSQWTWMNGSESSYSYFGVNGVYGILGTPSPSNTPGGREDGAAWTDAKGNLWFFGGEGADSTGNTIGFGPNDLWEYRLASSAPAKAAMPTISPLPGAFSAALVVTLKDSTANATIYYSKDGSSASSTWNPYTGPITLTGSETVTAVAMAPGASPSTAASAAYQLPAATPSLSLPSGTYNLATVQISDATPSATIYYTTNGSTPTSQSKVYSGPISVSTTETITAMAMAAGSSESALASATYTIASKTVAANEWTWMGGASTSNVFGHAGVYGTKGKAAAGNLPGSRENAIAWTDKNGNRWLFGGLGLDSASRQGYLNDLWEQNAATGLWAWIGGASTLDGKSGLAGVYGTQGEFAATNAPGSRESATAWTDKNGNLWMFGGSGFDIDGYQTTLDDLWKFNPSSKEWAWIAGSISSLCPNNEGDYCPKASVYGSLGAPAPGNMPGARYEAAGWVDATGNLWLFGGNGIPGNGAMNIGSEGALNDLWEYTIADNEWTWISGNSSVPEDFDLGWAGVYGQLQTPNPSNTPGGRFGSAVWTDAAGNLWLFGGYGFDEAGYEGDLNDLWEFNPDESEWTWMGGSSLVATSAQVSANYGVMGQPSAANQPGGRETPAYWQTKSGNVWIYGGIGRDGNGTFGYLDDVWEFNTATLEWTWMAGHSEVLSLDSQNDSGRVGVFGVQGIAAAGDEPGSRYEATFWSDAGGDLWVMGGNGFDSTGALGYLNDLWRFKPLQPEAAAAAPVFSLAPGDYTSTQTLKITDSTSGAKIYYTTDGATPTASSTLYTAPISVSQTTLFQAVAIAANHGESATVQALYVIGK